MLRFRSALAPLLLYAAARYNGFVVETSGASTGTLARRIALVATLLVVLFAPLLLSPPQQRQQAPLELVVITPHQEAIRREFSAAFSQWHELRFGERVSIDYRSYGGNEILRYFDERAKTTFPQTGTYEIDVIWGGGDFLYERQLRPPGYLARVDLGTSFLREVYPEPLLRGLPLYDMEKGGPRWFGTVLASFGIVYNLDLLAHLGVREPTSWHDLADPRLAGQLVLVDPTRSASGKQVYMIIVERAMADASAAGRSESDGWADGMGLLRLMAANARSFTDSSSTAPVMVSAGEAAAATAIDFYGRSQAAAVGHERMGYVEPLNATIINPDPIAMATGARRPELARRFIEFVLSPDGQMLWNTRAGAPGGPRQTSLRRMPVRQDAYLDMTDFTDLVNPFAVPAQFNKSGEREKTWGILDMLMQASCIDVLDELRETRATILRSPRAKELDARLGRFPFDEKEALERHRQWRAAKAPQRLAMQRQWTREFKQEYAELRAAACR